MAAYLSGVAPFQGPTILEFRREKVAHERIYITEPWEAAEWRAPWRAAETPGSFTKLSG
jgi:hypothetical protein